MASRWRNTAGQWQCQGIRTTRRSLIKPESTGATIRSIKSSSITSSDGTNMFRVMVAMVRSHEMVAATVAQQDEACQRMQVELVLKCWNPPVMPTK